MSDPISVYADQLKAILKENPIEIVTAVHVSNPNRRVWDIGNSWDPLIVVIDYLK